MQDTYRNLNPAAWMGRRMKSLLNDRSQFDAHVRAVAENLLPRQSRFQTTDRNRGGNRNQNIIDSAGTQALRVLSAGMMAGMTSPARPWIKLTVQDDDLAKDPEVKAWLAACTRKMEKVFRKSNTYNMLHFTYRELGGFGTSCTITEDNFDRVIHHAPMTFGEYALGLDHEGSVNTVGRDFELSVEQAIAWFGKAPLSQTAQSAYANGNYDAKVTVRHIIEPRTDRDPSKMDARNKAWKSCYVELGREGAIEQNGGYLRESGYRFFPGLCPRWDVLFNDTYGSSPGMEALGDLLQLQQEQYRKSQAIDYMADPPLQVPVQLRNSGADLLPGGVSYYDGSGPNSGIRSAFEVKLDLQQLLGDIGEVKQRINSAFYADMFLMLSNIDHTGMTATEVAERHEEKLLLLGPVIERLHTELLEPLVLSTFTRMVEADITPPVPEQLSGHPLEVEFISTLAQAQRAVGVNSIDRLIGHIGVLANAKPEVVDNYDADASVERYADMLGVDPDLIVPGDKVALVRQDRAKAQAAAQAAENADKAAGAMAKMGTISTGPESNAGSDILSLFSGYNSPSTTELG